MGGDIAMISVKPISIRCLRRRLDIGPTVIQAITPPIVCIESYRLWYEVKTQPQSPWQILLETAFGDGLNMSIY